MSMNGGTPGYHDPGIPGRWGHPRATRVGDAPGQFDAVQEVGHRPLKKIVIIQNIKRFDSYNRKVIEINLSIFLDWTY